MLIDDSARPDLESALGTRWRGVSDRVMGGISRVRLDREALAGRACLRLRGEVRLDNAGGFIQAALDLDPAGEALDVSAFLGLRLTLRGNDEDYAVHLRTSDLTRPWQSYRSTFRAPPRWREIELPFAGFRPHRTEAPFDPARLRRIGLVAIGRHFDADLAVARLELYGRAQVPSGTPAAAGS